MYLKTQGLVLRVTEYRDSDAMLTVLTKEQGLMSFKARGVRSRRSQLKSACQLLCFSEFTLLERQGYYTVSEAVCLEMFQPMRNDIELLALCSYFAQAAELLSQQDVNDGEVLSRWLLLSNVPADVAASELALWYYWRWRIESFFKLLKSAELAAEVGARSVVVHPPFRWQGEYATRFEATVRDVHQKTGIETPIGATLRFTLEKDRRLPSPIADELDDARLAADLDRLDDVDDRHVADAAREARTTVAALLEPSALALLQEDVDAGDDLLDVDRLGQVVVDAQLEAADLVLDRVLGGQEDERDLTPVGVDPHPAPQLEAVAVGERRLRDDEVRRVELELVERVVDRHGGRDREPCFAQRHFEDPQAASVPINEEQALLRHEGRDESAAES